MNTGGIIKAPSLRFIITASVVGTVIDWYDFFTYATLSTIIATVFFPSTNYGASLLATFAAFSVGFLGRPVGAIVFGRLGDKYGRKNAFILTMLTMGIATSLIGLVPSYQTAGILAPVLIFILRIIQGIGVGGEYGGAFIYIGENAPDEKRGFYGSFVQIAASSGFVLSLLLSFLTRLIMGNNAFNSWGWRLPFLYSIILVIIALYFRLKLLETPIFKKLSENGKTSQRPLYDTFVNKENWKRMLIAGIFGSAGVGTTWYTANIYAYSFLVTIAKVNLLMAQFIVGVGLSLPMLLVPLFGYLSDKWGRKPLLLIGYLLSAIIYLPVYDLMFMFSSPPNIGVLIFCVLIQQITNFMIYAPMPAWFVEYFKANIRFTSLNFAWNIGVIIGGFQPFIATAIFQVTHSPLSTLYYSIGVSLIAFLVGLVFYKETKGVKIWEEIKH